MGVLIHILGDCANNLGVVVAGLVIWLAEYHGRYYADPAVSMAIAIMILLSSLPLSEPPRHPSLCLKWRLIIEQSNEAALSYCKVPRKVWSMKMSLMT